jgi:8-oxo-dGTP pyrophosphatase MutT (NUDIX family)
MPGPRIPLGRLGVRHPSPTPRVRRLTLDLVRSRLSERSPVRDIPSHFAEAAVAVILAPAPGGGPLGGLAVLLIRRAERSDDPWSGHMAFPGGRRDPGDPGLLATATRETLEETGIPLPSESLLAELDDVRPHTPALPPIVIRPFVFGLQQLPPVAPSGEVAGHLWVPLDDLAAATTDEEILIFGAPRRVHGYRIGSDLVWGLTERIVTPLLELLK